MQFNSSLFQLQTRLLFSIVVAGKSAAFADKVLNRWLYQNIQNDELPFDAVKRMEKHELKESLVQARTGNYKKLTHCFYSLARADINLLQCKPEDLEKIKGIGAKTSRFFLLWTRPNESYAALDVHVLRWLKNQGYKNVPKSTPTGKRYAALEKIFLDECLKRNMKPRDLDWKIWKEGSEKKNVNAFINVCPQANKI